MTDTTLRDAALRQARERHQELLDHSPRIAPPPLDGIGEEVLAFANRLRRAALGPDARAMTLDQVPEIVPTMFCHRELWERFAGVSIQLLGRGELSTRDRELVILRVAWNRLAPFEWAEHVRQAKIAGVTEVEIERVIEGVEAAGWSAYDRALLRATDELTHDAMISDATWATLAERLNDKQLFELTVLIGQFTAVAYFQNALRLRLPKGSQGLEQR